ncbi:MAG: methionine biosynthesis protein MetW [Leptospiraceae bacterium]|nr:methionine biosynthesis protein MetW [Leptospiraceae bacterium]MCB1202334.1 methionine biosynthesis protein MetW [Leptospiraceae bacterium]
MISSMNSSSFDYLLIEKMIPHKASVLDLGCGDGSLLALLQREKKIREQGIEIDKTQVYACVEKGLNVFLGDLDSGLEDYTDATFDFVIMHHSVQELRNPGRVLNEAFRVGKKVIVSFPNFAHINNRFQIFFKGRTPQSKSLPYPWYDSPNLHFLSINDFQDYCKARKIKILQQYNLKQNKLIRVLPNLLAESVIFLLEPEGA